ncbi:cyclic nucleotide-binding domain-containing protein [Paenibacillus sp. GYB003]|uniref:cyclic nucleotide-binding domain-containing protein n=1 Tax=Paenibacillus sp. GYB003 TaxID=2994392 RepID=UPI002F969C2D
MSKIEFLNIPLFAEMDRVFKARLLTQFTQHSYRRGELLFEEGEFGDSLYIIMQGKVRVYLQSDGDRTLAVLGERESLGEMSLLTGDPRSAAARAETDVVVLRLLKEQFDALLEEHNSLAIQFANILADRLVALNIASGPAPTAEAESGLRLSSAAADALPAGGGIPSAAAAAGTANADKPPSATSQKLAEMAASTASRRTRIGRGALLALFAGGLLYVLLAHVASAPRDIAIYIAIVCAGIAGIIAGGWSPIAAVPLMTLAVAVSGTATAGQLVAGFSDATWFTAILYAVCAQVVYQSGMVQRLLLTLLVRSEADKRMPRLAAALVGLLAPALLPSAKLREEAFRAALPPAKTDALLLPSAALFVQGSLAGWLALTVLDVPLSSPLLPAWLTAALPVTILLAIAPVPIRLFAKSKAYEPTAEGGGRANLREQLKVIGTWTYRDTLSLMAMAAPVPAMWLAGPEAGEFAFVWIAAAALACLLAIHRRDKPLFGEPQAKNWIVFGLLAGLAQPLSQWSVSAEGLAAGERIWGHVPPLVALLLLLAAVALVRAGAGTLPAVWIGLLLTMPAWTFYGLSSALPAMAAMLGVYAGDAVRKGHAQPAKEWFRRSGLAGLALMAAFPVWQLAGLTAAKSAGDAAPALQERLLLDIVLPDDPQEAASVRRGAEFAISGPGPYAAASGADSPAIRVRYVRAGETAKASEPEQAAIGIAAEASPPLSAETPWIVLNGQAPSGPRPEQPERQRSRLYLSASKPFEAGAWVGRLADRGASSVAIYYAPSADGKELASSLEAAAEAAGIAVADRLMLVRSDEGQRGLLAKWQALGVSAIVLYDPERQAGPALGAALRENGAYKPQLLEVPAAYGPDRSDSARGWARAFEERYGLSPDRNAAAAYDAVLLAAEAAKRAGRLSPDALSDALNLIRQWPGMLRDYDFDREGR